MLQEQEHRGTLVAVFGMTAWTFSRIIIGGTQDEDAPFSTWDGNYPVIISGMMTLFSCLLISLIYYPIFCCITSRSTIAYVLGTVYCWLFGAYFVVFNLPQVCQDPTAEDARRYLIDIARKIPGLIFIVFICFAITWQSVRSLFFRHSKHDAVTEAQKDFYHARVRLLLAKREKRANVKLDSKLVEIIEAKIYRNVPGFRYSVTILAATIVSITLAYMVGLYFSQIGGVLSYLLPSRAGLRNFGPIMMRILEEWWMASHIIETDFEKYGNLIHDEQNNQFMSNKIVALVYLSKLITALSSNSSRAESSKTTMKYTDDFKFWFRLISACIYAALFISFMLIISAMESTLQTYRRHLLYIQKGCLHKIPKMKSKEPKGIVISSAKFAGYQFGYSSWGFCVQFFTISVFLSAIAAFFGFVFRYNGAWLLMAIAEKYGPAIGWLIIIKILQSLLVNSTFLQGGSNGDKVLAIDNRFAFFNYQYFMVFTNAPLGLFSCLMRILKAIGFGIWSLPRLDGSTLSRRFEQYDNGFASYVSLLHLENSITNPVLNVFVNLLVKSRKQRISRGIQSTGYHLEKSLSFLDCKSLFSNRRVVRNRWHLYVTLSNNPGLRASRQSRLDVPTMVSRMIRAASGLHDYLLDDWHYQGYDNPSWHM